jgi:hypothetical protein
MAGSKTDADQWICTRRFVADEKGKRMFATAKIGRPEKSGKDWACPVAISNIGMKKPRLVYGVDPMQAVILALDYLRVTLRSSGTGWRWIYGERDELGISRRVPDAFGRRFAARLESIIDAEIEKLVPEKPLSRPRDLDSAAKSDSPARQTAIPASRIARSRVRNASGRPKTGNAGGNSSAPTPGSSVPRSGRRVRGVR